MNPTREYVFRKWENKRLRTHPRWRFQAQARSLEPLLAVRGSEGVVERGCTRLPFEGGPGCSEAQDLTLLCHRTFWTLLRSQLSIGGALSGNHIQCRYWNPSDVPQYLLPGLPLFCVSGAMSVPASPYKTSESAESLLWICLRSMFHRKLKGEVTYM